MNTIPLFSGEISLYSDIDEGLRIECSESYSEAIKGCLVDAGFQCNTPHIKITGTPIIHNWIEFYVVGGNFEAMKQAVLNCLNSASVTVVEESFISKEEIHIRLNLTNISVFDK
jgi:hypothetical protein